MGHHGLIIGSSWCHHLGVIIGSWWESLGYHGVIKDHVGVIIWGHHGVIKVIIMVKCKVVKWLNGKVVKW